MVCFSNLLPWEQHVAQVMTQAGQLKTCSLVIPALGVKMRDGKMIIQKKMVKIWGFRRETHVVKGGGSAYFQPTHIPEPWCRDCRLGCWVAIELRLHMILNHTRSTMILSVSTRFDWQEVGCRFAVNAIRQIVDRGKRFSTRNLALQFRVRRQTQNCTGISFNLQCPFVFFSVGTRMCIMRWKSTRVSRVYG